MTVDADVSQMLEEMQHNRHDPWGTHAKRIAEGIDQSGVPGLLGDISDGLGEVQGAIREQGVEIVRSVTGLAAVNAAGFSAVCGQLARQTESLATIQELLANPLSTAAAERYRRGAHALQEGWFDDALLELDASITQDPFQPLTHYSRGLALARGFHRGQGWSGVDQKKGAPDKEECFLSREVVDQVKEHLSGEEYYRVLSTSSG